MKAKNLRTTSCHRCCLTCTRSPYGLLETKGDIQRVMNGSRGRGLTFAASVTGNRSSLAKTASSSVPSFAASCIPSSVASITSSVTRAPSHTARLRQFSALQRHMAHIDLASTTHDGDRQRRKITSVGAQCVLAGGGLGERRTRKAGHHRQAGRHSKLF